MRQPGRSGLCRLFCLGSSVVFSGVAAVSGERLPANQRQRLWTDMQGAGLSPEEMGRVFRAFLGVGTTGVDRWLQLEELLARCHTALDRSFSRRELAVFELGGRWALATAAAAKGWASTKAQHAYVAQQLAEACKCESGLGLPSRMGETLGRLRASVDGVQQFCDEIVELQGPVLRDLGGW